MLSRESASTLNTSLNSTAEETKINLTELEDKHSIIVELSRDSDAFKRPKPKGQRPLLIRYLVFIIIGSFIVLLPGILSYFLYTDPTNPDLPRSLSNMTATGMSIEGVPFIRYAIFMSISWTLLWTLQYACLVVPEVAIRIINGIARAFGVLSEAQVLNRWVWNNR
jgi:hypothetical protein